MFNKVKKSMIKTGLVTLLLTGVLTGCQVSSSSETESSLNQFDSLSNTSIEVDDGDLLENHWEVTSVNKTTIVDINLSGPYVTFSVSRDEVVLVKDSKVGITIDQASFQTGVKYTGRKVLTNKSFSYDNITGKVDNVTSEYNEILLTFSDLKDSSMLLDIIFRAFNDGYTFRYQVRNSDGSSGEMKAINEETTFALPDNATCFYMPYVTSSSNSEAFSYEDYYYRSRITNLDASTVMSMPLLYRIGDTYSLISESDIHGHDYIGSFLRVGDNNTLHTIPAFGANEGSYDSMAPDPWLYHGYQVSYPFTSPWRVGIAGTLSDIVSSNLIEESYGDVSYWKPDNFSSLTKEEQDIYNYDWVEPGVSIWSFIYYSQNSSQYDAQWDYDLQTKYIDYAKQMGYKYVLLDGGWQRNFAESKRIVDYATSQNVKILVWVHAFDHLGTPERRTYYLDLIESLGIAGIKPDYYDGQFTTDIEKLQGVGESQHGIDLQETVYQECAKRKLLVNPHGSNKPTGERRIYPNVLNREAVRGNEFAGGGLSVAQLVTIPYIRGVIGPTDFTPTLVPINNSTTVALQMGMMVMYESGMPSLTVNIQQDNEYHNTNDDYPDAYRFIRDLPATWDEIKYLSGEPLNSCAIARRKGGEWWIGGGTVLAKTFDIKLDFLETGTNYVVETFADGDLYTDLSYSKQYVTKDNMISVDANSGGGFAVRISKLQDNKEELFDFDGTYVDEVLD